MQRPVAWFVISRVLLGAWLAFACARCTPPDTPRAVQGSKELLIGGDVSGSVSPTVVCGVVQAVLAEALLEVEGGRVHVGLFLTGDKHNPEPELVLDETYRFTGPALASAKRREESAREFIASVVATCRRSAAPKTSSPLLGFTRRLVETAAGRCGSRGTDSCLRPVSVVIVTDGREEDGDAGFEELIRFRAGLSGRKAKAPTIEPVAIPRGLDLRLCGFAQYTTTRDPAVTTGAVLAAWRGVLGESAGLEPFCPREEVVR